MSEPIEYRIVRNLQAALQGLTRAGGYHYDVPAVAVKLDPNHGVEELIGTPDAPGPRPFIVLEIVPEKFEYFPTGDIKLRMPFVVHWVSDSIPTDDESRLLTFYRGCADVEQAIAVDGSRGGLAADTRVGKRTFDTAVDGAQVWAQIEIEILQHRTFGRPNG